jgi:hypothetical protein
MFRTMKALAARSVRALQRRFGDWVILPLLPKESRFSRADFPELPGVAEGKTALLIARTNAAGQGFLWSRACSELPGSQAVNMTAGKGDAFGFGSDVTVPVNVYRNSVDWAKDFFWYVTNNFTHVLIEAETNIFGVLFGGDVLREIGALQEAGIHVAFAAYGSDIRSPEVHRRLEPDSPFYPEIWDATAKLESVSKKNRAIIEQAGIPVFVSTLDLLIDVPDAVWVPIACSVDSWRSERPVLEREVPVVVHAPSKAAVKGTDLIEPTLIDMHSRGIIDYQPVRGVPQSKLREIYTQADIVLEQFRLGMYATSAIEAMAAGRVVVGHINDFTWSSIPGHTGRDLPIVRSRGQDIERTILDILARREDFRRVAREGVEFAHEVHDGRRSAQILAENFLFAR